MAVGEETKARGELWDSTCDPRGNDRLVKAGASTNLWDTHQRKNLRNEGSSGDLF